MITILLNMANAECVHELVQQFSSCDDVEVRGHTGKNEGTDADDLDCTENTDDNSDDDDDEKKVRWLLLLIRLTLALAVMLVGTLRALPRGAPNLCARSLQHRRPICGCVCAPTHTQNAGDDCHTH